MKRWENGSGGGNKKQQPSLLNSSLTEVFFFFSFSISRFPFFFNSIDIKSTVYLPVCVATNDSSSSSSNLNKNLNICSCFSYFFLPIKLKRAVKSQTQQQQQKVVWNNKKEREKWEAKMKKGYQVKFEPQKDERKKGRKLQSSDWRVDSKPTNHNYYYHFDDWIEKGEGKTRKKKNQSRNLDEKTQHSTAHWTELNTLGNMRTGENSPGKS